MIQRLFTPGPVRVPPDILAASAEPPMHHRSDDFLACSQRVWTNLQAVFRTQNPVLVLAGSGMTGIEAAIASTIQPPTTAQPTKAEATPAQQTVVVLTNGRFGERIADIVRMYGATPLVVEAAWGESIGTEAVANALRKNRKATILWMVHSDTSTGVTLDIEAIAKAARTVNPELLICVDAVGSLGIHPLETDDWGLDIVTSGIQKGLMCPPGLACVSVSARAQKHIAEQHARSIEHAKKLGVHHTSPYTLDLGRVLASQRKGLFTWTPPVTLVRALDIALRLLLHEGLEHAWQRHTDVTHMLQEGLRDRGFTLFGEATSHAVTPIVLERANQFRELLFERHAIVIANGQKQLSGKAVRIGTCGSLTRRDILELFSAIDDVMPDLAP